MSWTTRGRQTSWGRVVRQFVALASGESVARLFGLVATLILARRLEPPGFGLVTLGITLVGWMVLGLRQARAFALGNVVARVAFLIGVVALIYGHGDVLRVPYLQALSELVYGLVIIAMVARGFGITRPRVDLEAWKETLR